eukprot:scaffold215086_cov25-Prasinocladus_malaysianus.AAC.2
MARSAANASSNVSQTTRTFRGSLPFYRTTYLDRENKHYLNGQPASTAGPVLTQSEGVRQGDTCSTFYQCSVMTELTA